MVNYCSVASCEDKPTSILTPINLKGVIITIPLCIKHGGGVMLLSRPI